MAQRIAEARIETATRNDTATAIVPPAWKSPVGSSMMKPRSPAWARAAGAAAAASAPSPAAAVTRFSPAVVAGRVSPVPVRVRTSRLRIRTSVRARRRRSRTSRAAGRRCDSRLNLSLADDIRSRARIPDSTPCPRWRPIDPDERAEPDPRPEKTNRATSVCRAPVARSAEAGRSPIAARLARRPVARRARPAPDARVRRGCRRVGAAPHRGRARKRDRARAAPGAARSRVLSPAGRTARALDRRIAEDRARFTRTGGTPRDRPRGTDTGTPQVHAARHHRTVSPTTSFARAGEIPRHSLPVPVGVRRRRSVSPVLQHVAVLGRALHDRGDVSTGRCATRRTPPGIVAATGERRRRRGGRLTPQADDTPGGVNTTKKFQSQDERNP